MSTIEATIAKTNIVSIYPNPASTFMLIFSEERIEELTIFDINNEKIFNVMPGSCSTSINTSKLKAGLHFLHIKTKKSELIRKIQIINY